MEPLFLTAAIKTASQLEHVIQPDNYVAFTFFIGTMAMMAASVFFFFELSNTKPEWRTSILVSGLNHLHCSSSLLLHERLQP